MKKVFSIAICFFIFVNIIQAQNFTGVYSDNDGSTYTGTLNRVTSDNFGNVINTTSYANSPINIDGISYPVNGTVSSIIVKRDENHDLVWAKSLSCGGATFIGDVYADDLSNIYVCGYFGNQSAATELNSYPFPLADETGMSLFVIKYSPNGTVLWSKSVKIGLTGNDFSSDLFKIEGNGTDKILICSPIANVGEQTIGTTTISANDGKIFFAGLNSDGDWQYANLIAGMTNSYLGFDFAYADNDDIFYTAHFKGSVDLGDAGVMETPDTTSLDCVFKSDSQGNFEWAHLFNARSWWKSDIVCDGNDAVVFGSFGNSISFGDIELTSSYYSGYGVKVDNDGNYIWAKAYGESEANFFTACKTENGYYIAGKTDPYPESNTFGTYQLVYANTLPEENQLSTLNYLLKLDDEGNVINGAVYSFEYETFNTEEMVYNNEKVYITGNVNTDASFGQYAIHAPQPNGSNYISIFSESNNIISGRSFYDLDSDNIFNNDDSGCGLLVNVDGGGLHSTALLNADFNIGTGTGTYTISMVNPPLYYTYNTTGHTADFGSLYGQTDFDNDFIFQPVSGQNDLMVDLVMGPVRPGFTGYAYVTVRNVGTTNKTGVVEFTLNHADTEITSTNPTASTLESNYAELPYDLNPTGEIVFLINYHTDVLAELESEVSVSATAPDLTDLTPENNTDTVITEVTGSFDPNSKEVYPRGDVHPDFIADGEALEYIINFQNTGTDTAFTVILVDTLSNNLDLSTFRQVSSSHNVVVNFYDNVVWFRFNQINLVDSVTNEELSHGFVKYIIKPKSTLVIGDVIENTAAIYFDYNEPVITNTTVTEITDITGCETFKANGKCNVYPNPCTKGQVYLKSDNNIDRIIVENIAGQLVSEVKISGLKETEIDLTGKECGIYLIKIFTEGGIETIKLLKSE